ncbi:MAG: PEP-CTERM sorting domain-containing protein [Acidobacteria bacterium]|nr:PEP-CTERM sorting domain-containing protein [Planctomycetota bacterium]MBE3134898.1 PEP-CTERM sorting domain-containing protein [Acidobacteriota bacterium]
MRAMHTSLMVAVVAVLVGLAAQVVLADWDVGDPFKMHKPQLPDMNGLDVNFMDPKVLADDWQCTQSGAVSDIHFWFSSRQDQPFNIQNVHLSIHKDIPAAENPLGQYSMPAEPALWQMDIPGPEVQVRWWGEGPQGWFDPNTQELILQDHLNVWQANIVRIPNPFIQEKGTIYWLDVSVNAISPTGGPAMLGWKTSMEHFNDDATWTDIIAGANMDWQELRDPRSGESLDLAFVITPEPATMALMGLGVAGILARRRRR